MASKIKILDILDIVGLINIILFVLQVSLKFLNQTQQPVRFILGIYIIYLIARNISKLNLFLTVVSFYLSIILIIGKVFEVFQITDSLLGVIVLIILGWIYKEGEFPKETIHRIGTIIGLK